MKKCNVLFALVFVVISIPFITYGETNANSFSLNENNIFTQKGETFYVEVNKDNSDDLQAFRTIIEFDESVFTLSSFTNGSAVTSESKQIGSENVNENNYRYIYVDSGSPSVSLGSDEGPVLVCEFKVNENVEAGDYSIIFHGDAQTTCSYNYSHPIFGSQVITTPGHYFVIGNTSVKNPYNSMTASVTIQSGNSTIGTNLTDSNFTAPTDTYFTDSDITITPSTSDLSFTVKCDKACVAAIENSAGTYTRLTGTAEGDAYKFTANSADDKIVVAVKGDVSGDGAIDSDDYGPLVAKYLETGTLNSLQSLIGDINADGVIDSDDYGPLVAAYLETGTISW